MRSWYEVYSLIRRRNSLSFSIYKDTKKGKPKFYSEKILEKLYRNQYYIAGCLQMTIYVPM